MTSRPHTYEGVALIAPVTVPYVRHSEHSAAWFIGSALAAMLQRSGLEKDAVTGEINYEPENHEKMVLLRDEKIRRIAKDSPQLELIGPEKNKLLVVTWGSVLVLHFP